MVVVRNIGHEILRTLAVTDTDSYQVGITPLQQDDLHISSCFCAALWGSGSGEAKKTVQKWIPWSGTTTTTTMRMRHVVLDTTHIEHTFFGLANS